MTSMLDQLLSDDEAATTPTVDTGTGEIPTLRIAPRQSPYNEVGKTTSQFMSGLNESLLALPDSVINVIMSTGEATGVIKPGEVPGDSRNVLHRFFSQSNYPERKKLIDALPDSFQNIPLIGALNYYGSGEQNAPENKLQQIAQASGTAGAAGLLMGGTTGVISNIGAKAAAPVFEEVGSLLKGGVEAAKDVPGLTNALRDRAGGLGKRILGHATQTADELLALHRAHPVGATLGEAAATASGSAVGKTAGAGEEEIWKSFGLDVPSQVAEPLGNLIGGAPAFVAKGTGWLAKEGAHMAVSPLGWGAKKVAPELYDKTVGEAKRAIVNRLYPKEGEKATNALVRRQIEDAVESAEANGRMDEARELKKYLAEKDLGPLKLTVAEETGDAPLLAHQARIRSEMPADELRQEIKRNSENARILQQAKDTDFAEDNGAADYVVQGLNNQNLRTHQEIDYDAGELQDELRRNVGNLPDLRGQAGQQMTKIREGLEANKRFAQTTMDEEAERLGVNRIGRARGIQGLKDRLQAQFFEKNELLQENVPKLIRKIVGQADKVLTFRDWRKLDELIGSEIGEALGRGKQRTARMLQEFRGTWKEWGNEAFVDDTGKLAQFKQKYDETVMPYEKGYVYKVLQKSRDSRPNDVRYRNHDEQLASSLLDGTEAEDFMRVTRNNPELRESMRNILFDNARDFAIAKQGSPHAGGLEPDALDTWIRRNRPALDELGLTAELHDIGAWNGAILSRQAVNEQRRNTFQKNALNQVLASFEKGEITPEEIIKKAIQNTKYMAQLKERTAAASSGDEDMVKTLRGAVIDHLRREEPDFFTDPDAFARIEKRYGPSLRGILGNDTLQKAKILVDGASMITSGGDSTGAARMGVKSTLEKFEDLIGTSAKSLNTQRRDVAAGRASVHTMAASVLQRFLQNRSTRNFDAIMKKALMDPDILKDLLYPTDSTGKVNGIVERRIKSVLYNMGISPEGDNIDDRSLSETNPEAYQRIFGEEPPAPKAPVKASAPPSAPKGMAPAPRSPPPAAPGPPPGLPSPTEVPAAPPAANGPQKPPFAALFPNDGIGAALAARQGYAEGGEVNRALKGDRQPFSDDEREFWYKVLQKWGQSKDPTGAFEDRRGEPIPSEFTPESFAKAQRGRQWLIEQMADNMKAAAARRGYAEGGEVTGPFSLPADQTMFELEHPGEREQNAAENRAGVMSLIDHPRNVYEGEADPRDPGRAFDMALTAMTGGFGGAPKGSLGSGPIRAHHASPHNFDEFKWGDEVRGKGEGAQAFGDGLYFAENPEIMGSYFSQFKEKMNANALPYEVAVDGKKFDFFNPPNKLAVPMQSALTTLAVEGSIGKAMQSLENQGISYAARISALETNIKVLEREHGMFKSHGGLPGYKDKVDAIRQNIEHLKKGQGGTAEAMQLLLEEGDRFTTTKPPEKLPTRYEVDLNTSDKKLMSQDKFLGDQPHVLDAIKRVGEPGNIADLTGGQWLRQGDMAGASGILKAGGLDGMKYLDALSRVAGEGTHNYVIFRPEIIKIVKKYGMAGIGLLPPAIAAQAQKEIQTLENQGPGQL